ncbi:MAG: SsrA-binding protein SmpB [Planctomycetota bacterium]
MAKKRRSNQTDTATIENRKARYNYAIGDTLEVGVMLRGSEVKSVRDGKVSLGEGFVRAVGEPPQLFLHNVNIGEYFPAAANGHKPTRTRKLLAHRKEITRLAKQAEERGTTLVPLKLYFKDGWAKLLIGVGRGKTHQDKRDTMRERDIRREIDRAMSKRV